MANSNGVISAPVSFADVKTVLGVSHTDLGLLCKDSNIKKWAKYKPVSSPVIDTITGQWDSANNKWLTSATWWKAGGMCGFTTTTGTEFGEPFSSSSTWSKKLINGQLGWTYTKPSGGANSVYRLQDFACYNHNAIQPYGELGATTIYVNNQNQAQIDWDVYSVDENNLQLSDFAIVINNTTYHLTDMYLGIILWSGSTYYVYTSSSKFSANNTLSITLSNISSGMLKTWNMMPFFTAKQYSGGFPATGNAFISMADTTAYSITLTTTGSAYLDMPSGEWNEAGTSVSYEVTAVNDTGSARNFSIVVSIRGGSTTGTSLGSVTIATFSVPAHSNVTKTGTITARKSGYTSYWIVAQNASDPIVFNQVEDYGGM